MSDVNPNFPIPGLDQSSKGFRDNFTTIKTELENLQTKQIQIIGSITSNVSVIGDDNNTIILQTSGLVKLNGYTVSTLPNTAMIGTIAYVTDANSPTYLGNLTGGGSTVCPAFFNGTHWVSI